MVWERAWAQAERGEARMRGGHSLPEVRWWERGQLLGPGVSSRAVCQEGEPGGQTSRCRGRRIRVASGDSERARVGGGMRIG